MGIDDPRGDPYGFGGIGVRMRLTGPPSWFDMSGGAKSVLVALRRYLAEESWAEIDYFVISGTHAYSDFHLTRLSLVPEPSGHSRLAERADCISRTSLFS